MSVLVPNCSKIETFYGRPQKDSAYNAVFPVPNKQSICSEEAAKIVKLRRYTLSSSLKAQSIN